MNTPRYPYVHVLVPSDAVESASDRLWILGAQGIEERDESTMAQSGEAGQTLLVASFADEATAQQVAEEIGGGATVHFIEGDEWRDGWREFFKPTQLTPRILVRPTWEQATAPEGVVTLVIDPGNAFGSGLHETTQLVLREVDARVIPGEKVLDVGCGSGILSIGALLLGAESALGTDIDPVALETTLENAELNGVAGGMKVAGRT